MDIISIHLCQASSRTLNHIFTTKIKNKQPIVCFAMNARTVKYTVEEAINKDAHAVSACFTSR